MTFPTLTSILDQHGADYLVLDFNHLFVAASLREEIWLLKRRSAPGLVERVVAAARRFAIGNASADRDLGTYSGGEQAILACLLLAAVVEEGGLRDLKLLLVNVLESISTANRHTLLELLDGLKASHGLAVYAAHGGRLVAAGAGHAH